MQLTNSTVSSDNSLAGLLAGQSSATAPAGADSSLSFESVFSGLASDAGGDQALETDIVSADAAATEAAALMTSAMVLPAHLYASMMGEAVPALVTAAANDVVGAEEPTASESETVVSDTVIAGTGAGIAQAAPEVNVGVAGDACPASTPEPVFAPATQPAMESGRNFGTTRAVARGGRAVGGAKEVSKGETGVGIGHFIGMRRRGNPVGEEAGVSDSVVGFGFRRQGDQADESMLSSAPAQELAPAKEFAPVDANTIGKAGFVSAARAPIVASQLESVPAASDETTPVVGDKNLPLAFPAAAMAFRTPAYGVHLRLRDEEVAAQAQGGGPENFLSKAGEMAAVESVMPADDVFPGKNVSMETARLTSSSMVLMRAAESTAPHPTKAIKASLDDEGARDPVMTVISEVTAADVTLESDTGLAPTTSMRPEANLAERSMRLSERHDDFGDDRNNRSHNNDKQSFKKDESVDGIGFAKELKTMPELAFKRPAAADSQTGSAPAHAIEALGRGVKVDAHESMTQEVVPVSPAGAVEAVLKAAERSSIDGRHRIELQFSVGGEDLSVRVELRADEVRTTFRTDSPELRQALAREWQAVSFESGDRMSRMVDPVFSSRDAATSLSGGLSGGASQHRDAQSQRPTAESFAAMMPRMREVTAAPATAAPAGGAAARPAAISTARHLHTLA